VSYADTSETPIENDQRIRKQFQADIRQQVLENLIPKFLQKRVEEEELRVVAEARAKAAKAGVSPLVKFEVNDVFDADIHSATVVTLYLLPDINLRLRPKLLKDLKPGARVVSHAFRMGDWKPDKQEIVDGSDIYLWTIPPK
jgi:FKBP-type peptidyl-prolyl cis-trans isomerase (trigger factor)